MKFLSVISLSLFISVKSSTARAQDGTFQENAMTNVKSPTATQDGTFHENVKTNVNSLTATGDGTFHENAKRNGNAGLNVDLRNDAKQESQLTRFRRSLSHSDDTQECYLHYFVEKTPPTGFKDPSRYMYICQGDCSIGRNIHEGCFSTLYDLSDKIPIYSAYVLRPTNWNDIGRSERGGTWRKESNDPELSASIKAITANIDSMYSNTGLLPCIHRGHLVPAETYSFSVENMRSTFVYTNAVPQYETFNSGQWSTYEEKIREYGKNTCAKNGGDLYLLTGISDRKIAKDTNGEIHVTSGPLQVMPENPKIAIPNSMWTAGCCISGKTVLGSFAVIGNNDPIKEKIYMSEVNVNKLEGIIGINNLFPGNDGCKTVKQV